MPGLCFLVQYLHSNKNINSVYWYSILSHPLDRTEMGRTKKAIVGGQNMTTVSIKVKMNLAEKGGDRLRAPKAFFQNGESNFFKN